MTRRGRAGAVLPITLLLVLATVLASCAAPGEAPPAPTPTPVPVRVDTAAVAGEPAAHPPGRVPPPGPYLPGFDAIHYHIELELPGEGDVIRATTTIDVAVLDPRPDTLRLDLTGLRVTAATLRTAGGRAPADDQAQAAPVGFRQHDGRIFIGLPAAVRAGDTLRVAISYVGTPDDGLIIRRNVHGMRGAFGDNWPDRGRFWFPSIDHPSDKATASFAVHAPPGWQVVANGRRIAGDGTPLPLETMASARPPADGVWRWRIDQPIPTYLMVIGAAAFATGSIDACSAGGTPTAAAGVAMPRADACVPTGFWSFPQDSLRAAEIFRRAGDMLAWYSSTIAPFPYPRLDHVQSATRFGGMENAGAIFYSEQAIARGTLDEGTVAHEIAHQWFGNTVTPARWADLWLSEGFATYFGALYFEHADGADVFREMLRDSWDGYLGSDVTDLPLVDTVRVPGDNLLGLLNANSYNKGGAVLHMLRGVLGDSVFFHGVRSYYQRHLYGNATTADLRAALEQASGRDLGWFFEQWVYRPGHPTLQARHRWDAQTGEAVITVEQLQRESWPVFRIPLQLEIVTARGTVRRDIELTERITELRVQLPGAPSAVTLDPDGWVLRADP